MYVSILAVAREVFVALRGSSSWDVDSLVVAHGLSCSPARGILVSGPGTELECPALEGGFLTTAPAGKSL